MRLRILFALLCASAATAVPGCEPERGPQDAGERLVLGAVAPTLLESGKELVIRGAGFAPGRSCGVALAGLNHRAGAPSREVRVALDGRARSSREIVLVVGEPALHALGREGSFAGELQVTCPAGEGGRGGVGVRGVEFDLVRTRGRDLAERRVLGSQAEAWLADVGIESIEVTPGTTGAVIARVRAGSAAQKAYLAAGDAIARASGVGVYALGDLAPPPGAGEVSLRVRRGEREHEVVLAGAVATTELSGTRTLRLSALCIGVLVCIAFFGPVPSASIAFARARSRLIHRRAHTEREPTAALPSALVSSLAALPVTLAWFALARAVPAGALHVDALPSYLAFAAMGAAVALGSSAPTLRERFRRTGAYAASALVLGVVLAALFALAGARSLPAIVDAQGAWPWQWAVFQGAAALAGFLLYVTHAGRMLVLPPGAGIVAQGAQPLGRLVVCGLGAAVFLGGWQSPFALLGPMLFVLKAWLLVALAEVAERAGVLGAGRSVIGLGFVTAAVALEFFAVPTPAFELGLGRVLFGSGVLIVACAALWVTRSAYPMGEPPTHPAPFA